MGDIEPPRTKIVKACPRFLRRPEQEVPGIVESWDFGGERRRTLELGSACAEALSEQFPIALVARRRLVRLD